jgi:hypothetical protein
VSKPAGDFNFGVTWYELLREDVEEAEEEVWLEMGRAAATCCWTAASDWSPSIAAAACCCCC